MTRRSFYKGCRYGKLEQRLKDREQEIRELREQLAEAQETLRAIREGEVDSLIVSTPEGPRVFTLQGADQTYRTHRGANAGR